MTKTINGVTFESRPHGDGSHSLSYTPADSDRHYAGDVRPENCPVCLLGMPNTHGMAEYRQDAHGCIYRRPESAR
jgi:hypothetical protein